MAQRAGPEISVAATERLVGYPPVLWAVGPLPDRRAPPPLGSYRSIWLQTPRYVATG